MTVQIASTSPGSIVLWVEDKVTKEYLLQAWAADAAVFDIQVGGRCETIQAAVHHQRLTGFHNVFGLVDRDFRTTNTPAWTTTAPVFYLPRLEMENYLLDWSAFAKIPGVTATAGTIEAAANAYAATLCWWMACRKVLSHCRDVVFTGFPKHPAIPVITDLAAAEHYITTAGGWWSRIAADTSQMVQPARLPADLQAAYATCTADLVSGQWLESFSGKEIFHHVRGRFVAHASDLDVAKQIGKWQAANHCVPQDIQDLCIAMKQRTGI